MTKKNVEMQDSKGNILYPITEAKNVIIDSTNVADALETKANFRHGTAIFKSGTNTIIIDDSFITSDTQITIQPLSDDHGIWGGESQDGKIVISSDIIETKDTEFKWYAIKNTNVLSPAVIANESITAADIKTGSGKDLDQTMVELIAAMDAKSELRKGAGVFPANSSTYIVENKFITENTFVLVVPDGTEIGLWDGESQDGKIIITSSNTETEDIPFEWYAMKSTPSATFINVDGGRVTATDIPYRTDSNVALEIDKLRNSRDNLVEEIATLKEQKATLENDILALKSKAEFKNGTATFPSGNNTYTVSNSFITSNTMVRIVFDDSNIEHGEWNGSSNNGYFTINSDITEASDVPFTWYAIKGGA